MTDLLPDDDSFVRTAIQGLRVPVHGPDFWDRLAGQLDDAADDLVAQGLMEEVLRSALVADLAQPEPSPHHVEDPWPEPEVVGRAAEPDLQVDLFGPVDEPVYEDEYEEDLADEAAAYDPTYDEPDAREPIGEEDPRDLTRQWTPAALAPTSRIRHDRAVVPRSLRRTSNAVLLALALLAAVLAVVAGLTLVHQRSDSASPVSSKQAAPLVDVTAPVAFGPAA